GLRDAHTLLRGTLRYPGWCRSIKILRELGLLNSRPPEAEAKTYRDFTLSRLGAPPGSDPAAHVRERYPAPEDAKVRNGLEWLGLFEDRALPPGLRSGVEVLAGLMSDKMSYGPGERDMVVLEHQIASVFPDGREELSVSTLVHFGTPGGDSAMARTVALPAAICGRLILEGAVREAGVVIPVRAGIYRPVLKELEAHGIRFEEKTALLR
ncbi:MAG: saccharopine dehydrogenase, partial [Candidatus Aminicenantes bacterium]|nr:saccharopine dehydrogenase [Candidatus Aminicenantes bacterium]